MNTGRKRLELLAIDAHRRSLSWCEFWDTHRYSIALAEPWNQQRFHRLVRRLSHLVMCGAFNGVAPIDAGVNVPMARELDDAVGVVPV
jgi:hypothetical protein